MKNSKLIVVLKNIFWPILLVLAGIFTGVMWSKRPRKRVSQETWAWKDSDTIIIMKPAGSLDVKIPIDPRTGKKVDRHDIVDVKASKGIKEVQIEIKHIPVNRFVVVRQPRS